jgi:hypothetical protein
VVPVLLMLGVPATVHAAPAWWKPLAFAGERVTTVAVLPGGLLAATVAGSFLSADGGRSFQPVAKGGSALPGPASASRWKIERGTVLTAAAGAQFAPDPGAPFLGASAHLIAAPAALPGSVVAVGSDNHVWRRSPSGRWATSFIVLPAGGLSGAPQVTSLAAFAAPITAAVYLGTNGYGVLLTEDGGDDWIRADPGLPENVLGLAADPTTKALYAATDQGLYVHRLQSFPAPPVYRDASLYLRWLGIALVVVLTTAGAVLGLRRAVVRPTSET